MFSISDDEVQEAFHVLHSGDHAKRRAAYEYAQQRLKIAFARALLEVEGRNAAEREARAMTSAAYEHATASFKALSEAYHEARDRREAASAVIEAWRTQQSDRRAMRNVA